MGFQVDVDDRVMTRRGDWLYDEDRSWASDFTQWASDQDWTHINEARSALIKMRYQEFRLAAIAYLESAKQHARNSNSF